VGISRAFQLGEHLSIVPSFNDSIRFATLLQPINILPKKKRFKCNPRLNVFGCCIFDGC